MTIAPATPAAPMAERIRVRLSGAVQGVGMRPFVHRLAADCGLAGFVLNGPDGVTIEVEGAGIATFLARLQAERPPLARIEGLAIEPIPAERAAGFAILASRGGPTATRIVPDAATCPACLDELFDPASRFHRYPFVNCTHCGPRWTISRRLPYDRAETSMAGFPLCAACAADYADPSNRRFHAEPVACPACGPRLTHPVAEIAAALRAGGIVALKGIGGFHLLCDATDEAAVATLRQRKGRDAKPFAVMVANAASVGLVAAPTAAEADLAATPGRPIVLMRARPGLLAPSVTPRLGRVGVVLAYAPLHHLLFAEISGGSTVQDRGVHDRGGHDWRAPNPAVLVATSANPGGEPLVVDDDDARARLAGIADLIVGHDRPIVTRADDSVMQVVAGRPAFLRRARGFVPDPIQLAEDGPDILAVGGHLKTTVTVTRGREAFVSQHIGDLDSAETLRFWHETVAHLLAVTGVRPAAVAADLHPDYRSTLAAEAMGLPVLRVQHHAAHLAAVAAEHGIAGPVLGLALDGHGLGDDGGAWGGELIRLDGAGWQRLGSLDALPLPGGDRAAREPWRMGVAALHRLGRGAEAGRLFAQEPLAGPLAARLAAGHERIATSSLGRLFDAAAALLGLAGRQAYEGQAAMEMEALVAVPCALDQGYRLEGTQLSFAPLLAALTDLRTDPVRGAELFHGTLIAGLAAWTLQAAAAQGLDRVALGGGCLMNRVLAEGLDAALRAGGVEPLLPVKLPPNDGGLSFGQAVLARRMIFREG
ncbi:carbamoyltransferase HypF [Prosthecomicrobium hirschii]|uniref:carbamoyltransferase HypF n=1 Tax=Prosthecodimorpha hirschii TaxID=665126 RepID=UPI00112C4A8C|nr:carbamoyltransferase HypF [Prosthecomicrobium hirschii]TPQ52966.1 carbamoyltransferase HypF [Prosthecomicrobium hirschii]